MRKHLLRNDTTLGENVFNQHNIVGGLQIWINTISTLQHTFYAQHEPENDQEPIGPGLWIK